MEGAFNYGQELLKSGELDLLIFDSTSGMLPKSRLGKALFGNLHVYAGAEHPHAAQNPTTI